MKKYGNVSGNSGISAYEIGPDWIKVKFVTGEIYKYSYSKAGSYNVEQMKELAKDGKNLASYISRNVSKLYD